MKNMIIGSMALMLALFPTTILAANNDDPTDLPHHGRFPAIICYTKTPNVTYQDVIEVQGGIRTPDELNWAKRYVTEVTEKGGEKVNSVQCHYWRDK